MKPLLDLIIEKVESHKGDPKAEFQMLVSNLDYNDYVGRIAVGKIQRGSYDSSKEYTLIRRSGYKEDFKVSYPDLPHLVPPYKNYTCRLSITAKWHI
jgi:GTP-binding protein